MLQLPNELILRIGQYIVTPGDEWEGLLDRTGSDLQSLSLTCKRLSTILWPTLFCTIIYRYEDAGHLERIALYTNRDRFVREHLPLETVKEVVISSSHQGPSSMTELLLSFATVGFSGRSLNAMASRISLQLEDVPDAIVRHWLKLLAHRVQHVSLITRVDRSSPPPFDSYIPLLKQLPALTSVLILDKEGYLASDSSSLLEYIKQADNIRSLSLAIGDLPIVTTPSLKSLLIGEGALEVAAQLRSILEPWDFVSSLQIKDLGPWDYDSGLRDERQIGQLVSLCFPKLKRLTCPMYEDEQSNFPPSLVYLHMTVNEYSGWSLSHSTLR